ncbi:MAG: 3'-5' exonuclease [Dysosmobacter sp.]
MRTWSTPSPGRISIRRCWCTLALGLGPCCIDLKRKIRYPTMARLALEEKLRRENLAEEQRILYVAMTRPKEKLILVDCAVWRGKAPSKLTAAAACPVMPEVVAEGKCFGDWILLPLLCRPEAAPLRDMAGVMAGGLYTWRYRPMAGVHP